MGELQTIPAEPDNAARHPDAVAPGIGSDNWAAAPLAMHTALASVGTAASPLLSGPRGPASLPAGAVGAATVLAIQRAAGNRAAAMLVAATRSHQAHDARSVATSEPERPGRPPDELRAAAVQRRPTVQRGGPPPTEQELQDVVDLMPIQPAMNALVAATEAECGAWKAWRGTFDGPVPGGNAYAAMNTFKDTVADQKFNWADPRILKLMKRQITGDNRQALTEMYAFSLGAGLASKGDSSGLAKVFGISVKALTHRYTLMIGYQVGVKGKIGIGVGYQYRAAGLKYDNDFGMTYTKPLNMRSLLATIGPPGFKAGAEGPKGMPTASASVDSKGSTDSLIFWMPDDWETDFEVVKVGASGGAGVQLNVKILHAIRVASDKHPPLAFDFMGGTAIKGGESYGTSAGASAGLDIEYGKGFEAGKFTASAPPLEEARKKAEEAKLIPPDEVTPTWRVVEAATVQFATGQSQLADDQIGSMVELAKRVAAWAGENSGCEIRFDIVGQASPRWRSPKKGQIPADLNVRLSEQRAEMTRMVLVGAWPTPEDVTCTFEGKGCEGPAMDLPPERARTEGTGSYKAVAEGADKDNNDAGYRVAVVTAWGKPAPAEPSS